MNQAPLSRSPFETLRRFAPRRSNAEPCELCSAALASQHQHLIEPEQRRLLCACDACAVLFSGQEDSNFPATEVAGEPATPSPSRQPRYRRVPRRVEFLADFQITDAEWDGLLIPIGMAFFFHSSPLDRVIALYPSPAGATESLLPLASWQDLVERNPLLLELKPDVEALLVNRLGGPGQHTYYRAPIDECYALVGLIRSRWRGLSGGTEVWQELAQFFARLKQVAVRRGGEPDA